ncbi:MAG: hypothetical protein RR733_04925, partial [Victivallaceae bacterium]
TGSVSVSESGFMAAGVKDTSGPSFRLQNGYMNFQNVDGERFLLKSGPFGCISHHHQVKLWHETLKEPFKSKGTVRLCAVSEIPNLSMSSTTYADTGWFRWVNVSLSIALQGDTTFSVGFSNFLNYDPFLIFYSNLIYDDYKTFLDTRGDYYTGVFAKIKPSGSGVGQTTDIKILGKLEVYAKSDMTTMYDLGWLYTYPPVSEFPGVPRKYGVTVGLWTETEVTLPSGQYVSMIRLPDSNEYSMQ